MLILQLVHSGPIMYGACVAACYGTVVVASSFATAGIALASIAAAIAAGIAAGAAGGATVCTSACAPFMLAPGP